MQTSDLINVFFYKDVYLMISINIFYDDYHFIATHCIIALIYNLSTMKKSHKKRATLLILLLALIATQSLQAQPKWNAPKEADNLKNPYAGNTTVLKEGKQLYTANCAPCHGSKGRGDGPAAAALNPKPADHSSDIVQKETDGSLFWKISEGHNPMPEYKLALTDNQRWELVNYIRTLAKNPKK